MITITDFRLLLLLFYVTYKWH